MSTLDIVVATAFVSCWSAVRIQLPLLLERSAGWAGHGPMGLSYGAHIVGYEPTTSHKADGLVFWHDRSGVQGSCITCDPDAVRTLSTVRSTDVLYCEK
jgi:hypothetical protein